MNKLSGMICVIALLMPVFGRAYQNEQVTSNRSYGPFVVTDAYNDVYEIKVQSGYTANIAIDYWGIELVTSSIYGGASASVDIRVGAWNSAGVWFDWKKESGYDYATGSWFYRVSVTSDTIASIGLLAKGSSHIEVLDLGLPRLFTKGVNDPCSAYMTYSLRVTYVKNATTSPSVDGTGDGKSGASIAAPATTYKVALMSDGLPGGILELKAGKVNVKKATRTYSGTVTTIDGKKHTIKKMTSSVTSASSSVVTLQVKDLGTLNLRVGTAGISGSLKNFTVSGAAIGGMLKNRNPEFGLSGVWFDFNGDEIISAFLPSGERISVENGKWKLGKQASIKYKRQSDGTYVLSGHDNPQKPNLSGLKLTYNSKTGLFKGSFYVYSIVKNKLKKYGVSVSGIVVDGCGYGIAIPKVKGMTSEVVDVWVY